MVLQLTSTKIAWSDSRTKTVTAPRPGNPPAAAYSKYLARSNEDRQLNFLQWLRLYDHEKARPKPYKAGSTLVAVKFLSIFNAEFFYQFLVMNYAHTDETNLRHDRENDLPAPIRYYVQAVRLVPELWSSVESIREYLAAEAHKAHHIDTVLNYLHALADIYTMWQIHLVDSSFATPEDRSPEARFPLSRSSPNSPNCCAAANDISWPRMPATLPRYYINRHRMPPKTGEDTNYFSGNPAPARAKYSNASYVRHCKASTPSLSVRLWPSWSPIIETSSTTSCTQTPCTRCSTSPWTLRTSRRSTIDWETTIFSSSKAASMISYANFTTMHDTLNKQV